MLSYERQPRSSLAIIIKIVIIFMTKRKLFSEGDPNPPQQTAMLTPWLRPRGQGYRTIGTNTIYKSSSRPVTEDEATTRASLALVTPNGVGWLDVMFAMPVFAFPVFYFKVSALRFCGQQQ